MTLHPGIAAKLAATSDHARPGQCPRCGAKVIRARVGRVAALDVVADPAPVDAVGEILARLDGRLTWRLIPGALGTARLAWRDPLFLPHARAGPVVADHRCPPQPVQEVLL